MIVESLTLLERFSYCHESDNDFQPEASSTIFFSELLFSSLCDFVALPWESHWRHIQDTRIDISTTQLFNALWASSHGMHQRLIFMMGLW